LVAKCFTGCIHFAQKNCDDPGKWHLSDSIIYTLW
jgi:hypothetical protein